MSGLVGSLQPASQGGRYDLGDLYQGGTIFYLNATKSGGYVADLTALTFDFGGAGSGDPEPPGYLLNAFGSGESNFLWLANNSKITSGFQAFGAVLAHTGGGYTDWFVPSKGELQVLIDLHIAGTLSIPNYGNSGADYFTSSDEDQPLVDNTFSQWESQDPVNWATRARSGEYGYAIPVRKFGNI